MKNLLALSFFPAFLPAKSGGEQRLFELYRTLSQYHRVSLLTSSHIGGSVKRVRHNSNFLEIRVPKDPAYAQRWSDLQGHAGAGDLSGPCLASGDQGYTQFHQEFLNLYGASDVIIHESPFLSHVDLFLGYDNKKRIYNSHNVEYDLYRNLHRGAETDVLSEIVRRGEERLCKHADLIGVCTSEDGRRFQELYNYNGEIAIVPNGVNEAAVLPAAERQKNLVFIGSGHQPNVTAARDIAQRIAPLFPHYHFDIMGSCLSGSAYPRNVTCHGSVSDAQKKRIFAKALAFVNPMADGGGSSLKIADVAAHHLPIISTPLGVRGFGFSAPTHYLPLDLANVETSMSDALADLDALRSAAAAASQHILENYSWRLIGKRFADAISVLADGSSGPAPLAVLNDYDPLSSVGGGATRIAKMYEAVAEETKIVMLCFAGDGDFRCEEAFSGQMLIIKIPKTQAHIAKENGINQHSYISSNDIVTIRAVLDNDIFGTIYACLSQVTALTICEHPYLVGLPQREGARFIYSSQNFETGLKRQMLAEHPFAEQLIADVVEAEAYAAACSELIVTVSSGDAESFSSAFLQTAPIVVVPNGAGEPVASPEDWSPLVGANAVFLGSAHGPNVEAAQYIIQHIAPQRPDIQFHFVGSVCSAFEDSPPNIRFWGVVSDNVKSAVLRDCQIALNPMATGSGSNVKVADYLKHGLFILSTEFGARGYEDWVGGHIELCTMSEMSNLLADRIGGEHCEQAVRTSRAEHFSDKLSMYAGGKALWNYVKAKVAPRPRILFVTYRYNDPALGGAEVYLGKLLPYLVKAGFDIDVVTPTTKTIVDKHRFLTEYPSEEYPDAIPTGNPHIRCSKFELDDQPSDFDAGREAWRKQSDFERALYLSAPISSHESGLLWGWSHWEGDGRWTSQQFGLYLSNGDPLKMVGHTKGEWLLRFLTPGGAVIEEIVVEGHFNLNVCLTSGIIAAEMFPIKPYEVADPRPLGLRVQKLSAGSVDLLRHHRKPLSAGSEASEIFDAHYRAFTASRDEASMRLTDMRGPHSEAMERYIEENISAYSLLVTNNVVFRPAVKAVEISKAAGVPSVLVPHAHFEDDYFHFADIYQAMSDADVVLASPKAAVQFLNRFDGVNAVYHSPGVNAGERVSAEDVESFTALYRSDAPYFLVLGRKSFAKGYLDTIAAVKHLRSSHDIQIVMIGPDEDGTPISEDFVHYLGAVDRTVVRGALANCVALVNMSESESFGMVLVEAGLAEVPVLANRRCPAFSDIIVDGQNGLLATKEELAANMERLLTDPSLRKAMGRHGHKIASDFDWDVVGEQFVDQCQSLIISAGRDLA